MVSLRRAASIDDLAALARRRLPRMVFDFLDGGAGTEASLRRNREALAQVTLWPRYFRDVSRRDSSVELFGRRYAAPVGVAPIGMANLMWPGADLILARMARDFDIPYVLSTAGTTAIEEVAAVAPDHTWFQLYVANDDAITFDLMKRAHSVGINVLVVTVDVPVPGKRNRDIRNGFQIPLRPTLANLLDLALRPAWLLAQAQAGKPTFKTLAPYAPPASGTQSLAAFMAAQVTSRLDCALMARIRDAWPGKLVVKGILSPEDVATAAELGADGVIVSNHGGRQLDAAPSTIEALAPVCAAAGEDLTVMMDGGIRSGCDVVRALSGGAAFTFCGRAFLYGVAAGGGAGAKAAAAMLLDEIDRTLGQIGRV